MPRDTEGTIRRLASQLFAFPVEDYLASEQFSAFCRDHDLVDAWKEHLESSHDNRPDLYGRDVIKNAFVLFLHHIFHTRPGDFLPLFTRFLIDLSPGICQALPLNDLKKDLTLLGYPESVIDTGFSILKEDGADHRNPQER